MKIAFSTLGCPTWEWERIVEAAEVLGYNGIAVRGIREILDDLRQAPPFQPERLAATKRDLAARGLQICTVDTSIAFHDPARMGEMLDLGRAHLDLAAELGAGGIRVFGDKVPEGETRDEVVRRVAAGLAELGAYAGDYGIDVLLETHGAFSGGRDARRILEMAGQTRTGAIWDLHHTWRKAGETPAETLGALGTRLRAVHLKDAVAVGGAESYCLLGRGDLPVAETVSLLRRNGFDGWLILEWEKRWHPEIEEPEIAFPQFIGEINRMLQM